MRKLTVVFLLLLYFPALANGALIVCEAPIQIQNISIIKEIRLSVDAADTHFIQLLPRNSAVSVEKILNDNYPVGIGEIEIYERADNQRQLWGKGAFLVTQFDSAIIIGIFLNLGRVYTLRLDSNGNGWDLTYYDQVLKERLSGKCN